MRILLNYVLETYCIYIRVIIKLTLIFLTLPHLKQTQSYLLEASAEPVKDSLHVASPLHGDDPGVILLIDPDQECLLIVVPAQREVKLNYTTLTPVD